MKKLNQDKVLCINALIPFAQKKADELLKELLKKSKKIPSSDFQNAKWNGFFHSEMDISAKKEGLRY